jgi:hypothetical protein
MRAFDPAGGFDRGPAPSLAGGRSPGVIRRIAVLLVIGSRAMQQLGSPHLPTAELLRK